MYIRTKDGIFLVDEERETYFIVLSKNWFEHYVPKERVIKTADKIEELCDGFYATENSCWEKDYYLFGNKDFEDFKDFTKDFPKGFARGFIATDKGLIYVAKFNKNGELELI